LALLVEDEGNITGAIWSYATLSNTEPAPFAEGKTLGDLGERAIHVGSAA